MLAFAMACAALQSLFALQWPLLASAAINAADFTPVRLSETGTCRWRPAVCSGLKVMAKSKERCQPTGSYYFSGSRDMTREEHGKLNGSSDDVAVYSQGLQ